MNMKRNGTNRLYTIILIVVAVIMYICFTYVQYKIEGANINFSNEISDIAFANISKLFILLLEFVKQFIVKSTLEKLFDN